MRTMNVPLPASMNDRAEAQTETGRYANARDLIRPDQVRNDKIAAMRRFVDDGLESAVGPRSSNALFAAAVKR